MEYIADEILVMRAGTFVMRGAPAAITAQVAGKVWECHVPARQADRMTEEAGGAQMPGTCVANVHYATDGHAVMRVVADTPPLAEATPLEPTLEDLYLYVFRDRPETGGDADRQRLAHRSA